MSKARNILLLEPGYKNKYPPLGLMKIAQYHKQQKHNVVFAKGEDHPNLTRHQWDRVYITTLFSFEWARTAKVIDRALELMDGCAEKIFVGGISASLMTEEYEAESRWKGIRFIGGLLSTPTPQALHLRGGDFGAGDLSGAIIDEMIPDYDILSHIDYQYPVHDAYFGYASRGCIRKCSFCGVPKLEGDQKDMPPISNWVNGVIEQYGEKKDLVLMDNNVTAAPKFNEIIAEITDLGFVNGAKLKRNGRNYKRRVDFNQGVDSRLLAKNGNLLRRLSKIAISPLRIAFDHWGVRKYYEKSIRDAAQCGLASLSNYMLYNFHDSPEDLYRRLILNIELNQELGIRIWSFPMRYQPVTLKDRSFVGKRWNKYWLRSFQIMLHATHGVVSGNPSFFQFAYGANFDQFMELLHMPHGFIFNRDLYFCKEGRPLLDDFRSCWRAMRQESREQLMFLLCGDPAQKGLRPGRYKEYLEDKTIDSSVRRIMRFYVAFGASQKMTVDALHLSRGIVMPHPEEKVEDAGLQDFDHFVDGPMLAQSRMHIPLTNISQ